MSKDFKVAYDARFSIGHYRGMGHFLRALIAGREQGLLGFCATGEKDASLHLIASGMRFYPLWEQLSLPGLVRTHKPATLIAPYNTAPLFLPRSVKLVMIVYDLIFLDRAPLSTSLYQNFGRLYRRVVVPRAVQRADLILTCSHYSADQLVTRLGVDRNKIRVVHCSLEGRWFGTDGGGASASRYILAVAGEAPSKNLKRAIAAFARYRVRSKDAEVRMKVAGVKASFHSVFLAEAHKNGVADAIDFLPYITDDEMQVLFQQAALFVMPSLSEGFGIPVLEAMASGVPVAASSSTCLQEVGGGAACYFDPYSVEDMAATMAAVLGDAQLSAAMSHQGRLQAAQFHPEIIRKQIDAFWDELEGHVEGRIAEEGAA